MGQADAADGQYRGGQQGHHDGAAGHGVPVDPPHPVPLCAESWQRGEDPAAFGFQGAGGGDGPGPAERLDEAGGELGLGLLVAAHGAGGVPGEGPQQQCQHGESGDEHDGQPGIGEGQCEQGAGGGEQRRHSPGQGAGRGAGLRRVAGQAGHQVAGGEAVGGPVRGEGQQVVQAAAA